MLDYANAVIYLSDHLTNSQKEILAQIESDYKDNWSYASEYPFFCGLVHAFEQFFSSGSPFCFDYSSAVIERMCTMPGMQRHSAFFQRTNQIFQKTESLMEEMDKDACDHLVSICCAWEQRLHSATIYSFYLGYCAGFEILERVQPMSVFKLLDKRLHLEYELGLSTPAVFGCK